MEKDIAIQRICFFQGRLRRRSMCIQRICFFQVRLRRRSMCMRSINWMCTHSSKAQPLANSMNTTPYGLPTGTLQAPYGLPTGARALILWGASVLKILKKPLGLVICFPKDGDPTSSGVLRVRVRQLALCKPCVHDVIVIKYSGCVLETVV